MKKLLFDPETQLILRFKLWFKLINNESNKKIFISLKSVK